MRVLWRLRVLLEGSMDIFEPKRLFVEAMRVFVKEVRSIRMLLNAMSVVVLTLRVPLEALQLLQRP